MSRHALHFCAMGLAVAACRGDARAPLVPSPPAAPTGPTAPAGPTPVASIELTPVLTTANVGERLEMTAILRSADGTAIVDRPVAWATSDSSVASVPAAGGVTAGVRTLAVGRVRITARAEGQSMQAEVNVVPANAQPAPLTVTSFRVIVFRYPYYPLLYYAPSLRLCETTGTRNAVVTTVQFTAPASIRSIRCAGGRQVAKGTEVEVFPDSYGDYEFSWDSPAPVALGTMATAVVTIQYDDGSLETITVSGPFVAGALPTTYSVSTSSSLACGG